MRISDWSSDVCSSDLHTHAWSREWLQAVARIKPTRASRWTPANGWIGARPARSRQQRQARPIRGTHRQARQWPREAQAKPESLPRQSPGGQSLDRKSVGQGKNVLVRVDTGGGGALKKKKTTLKAN